MKFLAMLLALTPTCFDNLAQAAACASIAGTYVSDAGLHIKYEQSSCLSVTRFMGKANQDGSVTYREDRTFALNGTPICNHQNACESARSNPDYVEFCLTFNGGVRTDEHGVCNHRGYKLSKDAQGNMDAVFAVFGCSDGFHGNYVKIFQKN